MVFFKNFLVVLLLLSTASLCLAKPRWVWLFDEKNGEKSNDAELTREVENDEENLMKLEAKRTFKACTSANCPRPLY
jgi:hypothetical protein